MQSVICEARNKADETIQHEPYNITQQNRMEEIRQMK